MMAWTSPDIIGLPSKAREDMDRQIAEWNERQRQSREQQQAAALQGQQAAWGTTGPPGSYMGSMAAYGAPEYSGFTDFEALQKSLFQEQMAGLSSEMGARGLLSSSEMQYGTVAAMAKAQAQRWQVELSERARKTQWDEQQAMNRWRMYQWAATFGQQSEQFYASLQAQRQAQQQQYELNLGSMSQNDFWNLQRLLLSV